MGDYPIFIILGYGIPQDITKNENYNTYLKSVFNFIYRKSTKPIIIACGGKTDMYPPYRRTEAEEIIKFFKNFIKHRPALKKITSPWKFLAENKSLSTLENLLGAQEIIVKNKIQTKEVIIFCEYTRTNRVRRLAKKIFTAKIKIVPLDFDTSPTRYLPVKFIIAKEKTELRHSFWALKNENNLATYKKLFQKKFRRFRQAGPDGHLKAIHEWWQKQQKINFR